MIVQMVFVIEVGGDKHLVAISPKALRQLHADLMGNLRGGLAGGKGLITVVGNGAIFFAKATFDRHHFLAGCSGEAVDAGHKALQDFRIFTRLLLGLVAAHSVFDHIREALRLLIGHTRLFIKGGIFGLVRVFNIYDHMAQPAVDAPEGGRRHVTPHSAYRFRRKRRKAHRSVGVPFPREAGFAGYPLFLPSARAAPRPP